MKEINLKFELLEHNKVVITNQNGDTYTSMSEELMDFLHSIKTTISPLPHQDGASADTNYITQFKIGQKVKDDVRGYGEGVVTDSDGQWILVRFKGCYQNYTSCGRWKRDHVITLHPIEVEKAVADGASAEDVVKATIMGYVDPNKVAKISGELMRVFKSETAKVVAEKDETINYWVKAYNEKTGDVYRLQSELSAANERIRELEKVLGKSPVKEIADEPRDKNGQTFDQWAEDNGCY